MSIKTHFNTYPLWNLHTYKHFLCRHVHFGHFNVKFSHQCHFVAMKYHFVHTLLFISAYSISQTQSKSNAVIRFYHPEDTTIDEFPCICRIWIRKSDGQTYTCGGTLIANDQIVTAAHCFRDATDVYACCGSSECKADLGKCYLGHHCNGVFVHSTAVNGTRQGSEYADIAYMKTNGSFAIGAAKPCPVYQPKRNVEGNILTQVGCYTKKSEFICFNQIFIKEIYLIFN